MPARRYEYPLVDRDGAKLTDGLIRVKLQEHRLLQDANTNVVTPGEVIKAGVFEVEFFTVAHSIPDACGLIIRTPLGLVVHTGDFKLDHTPVMDQHTDLIRLAQVGAEGCLLLLGIRPTRRWKATHRANNSLVKRSSRSS